MWPEREKHGHRIKFIITGESKAFANPRFADLWTASNHSLIEWRSNHRGRETSYKLYPDVLRFLEIPQRNNPSYNWKLNFFHPMGATPCVCLFSPFKSNRWSGCNKNWLAQQNFQRSCCWMILTCLPANKKLKTWSLLCWGSSEEPSPAGAVMSFQGVLQQCRYSKEQLCELQEKFQSPAAISVGL